MVNFSIFCCLQIALSHSILVDKESTFSKTEVANISDYLGGFTLKEVRGGSRITCGSQCTKHDECSSFIYHNNRCVLIGSSTLPGNDVNLSDVSTSVIYKKRRNEGKIITLAVDLDQRRRCY